MRLFGKSQAGGRWFCGTHIVTVAVLLARKKKAQTPESALISVLRPLGEHGYGDLLADLDLVGIRNIAGGGDVGIVVG